MSVRGPNVPILPHDRISSWLDASHETALKITRIIINGVLIESKLSNGTVTVYMEEKMNDVTSVYLYCI